jgi:hypothetical protein
LAAAPPPANGDSSCHNCTITKNQPIPRRFPIKGIQINIPTVAKTPRFTILVIPPTKQTSKTAIPTGAVVHVTVDKKTAVITVSVLTSKGPLKSWNPPLEFTVPKSTTKGKIWVLQMQNPDGSWKTLTTNPRTGQVAVYGPGVYRWQLVTAPKSTKK